MRVSVVIPVYNAEPYLRQAVESALIQPETYEVLLAEDGSSDDSLALCQTLRTEYDNVKMFQHPGGVNRGAGVSRNLGIHNATADVIALLDADDYFLPGRFAHVAEILDHQPEVDGVYEPVENFYEDEQARAQTRALNIPHINKIWQSLAPEALFDAILSGEQGQFLIHGLVVRKSLYEKTGYFDAFTHEDYAMYVKMAALGRLVPGETENPVAMRRIHASNTIASPRPPDEQIGALQNMWQHLWLWSRAHLDQDKEERLFQEFLKATRVRYQNQAAIQKQLRIGGIFTKLVLQHPALLQQAYFRHHYLQQFRIRRLLMERLHGS